MLASGAVYSQQATTDLDSYLQRSAKGDITQPGGARRIAGDDTAMLQSVISDGEVKNVILFIGDGMGDSEITIARNYAEGAGGFFKGIDALPMTGQYTHYSLDKATGKPDYVTDSAASGTAWATGVKTYNGAIGVDIHGAAARVAAGARQGRGLGTGDITTAEIQDATPAVLIAHVTLPRTATARRRPPRTARPTRWKTAARGSIAEQALEHAPDIVMGGGATTFDETGDGRRVEGQDAGRRRRRRAASSSSRPLDEMEAVTAADQDQPVLGLFAPGNMPVRWSGPLATYHGNIDKPPVTCAAQCRRARRTSRRWPP